MMIVGSLRSNLFSGLYRFFDSFAHNSQRTARVSMYESSNWCARPWAQKCHVFFFTQIIPYFPGPVRIFFPHVLVWRVGSTQTDYVSRTQHIKHSKMWNVNWIINECMLNLKLNMLCDNVKIVVTQSTRSFVFVVVPFAHFSPSPPLSISLSLPCLISLVLCRECTKNDFYLLDISIFAWLLCLSFVFFYLRLHPVFVW